jgi:arylsulfatase A-like enzyme
MPADWRRELHYEFDFRDVPGTPAETVLGLSIDECSLCVVQDDHYKYVHFAALPPLLFDLARDPNQFHDVAADPAYGEVVRDYAQRALSWRMRHADKTLTHYRATPQGLEHRVIAKGNRS